MAVNTLVVGGGLAILEFSRPVVTGGFLAGVVAVLALEAVVFGRVVVRTHRQDGPQRLTLATGVTLVRAALLAVLAGFLLTSIETARWLAGGLFATAVVLDAVDGPLARARGSVTELGDGLDTEVDGLTVLLGAVLVVSVGVAPIAFLLVGVTRPAFAVGCWWRRRNGRPVAPLPSSRLRRPLGGAVMVVIWLALVPVPGTTVSRVLTAAVAVPFLWNFGRDWLAVTVSQCEPGTN
ncbi:CDP-alcohol phosphatidyltransferase family protein [Natrialbaceae archaeon A-gly3]